MAVLIGVGATLGWQSYGDEATEMLAARAPALAPLLPVLMAKPISSTVSAGRTQQLEALSSNIDAVRASVDQLAARQDQMAQRIAAMQAVEEDIRQKISFTPPPPVPAPLAAAMPQPKPAAPRVASPAAQLSPAPRPAAAGPTPLTR